MRRRPFPLHTGIAEVTAVNEVTPTMARFTLTHPAFADFGVEQPGEIITLGWCDEGEELVLPELGWRFPGGREQHWRNYTVRAIRPKPAEVDVDFFLHGDIGYASAWAERARPGDPVGFAGPRLHWKGLNGYDWSLLVADETGLPALLAILETLPAGHRSIAIASPPPHTRPRPFGSSIAATASASTVVVPGGRPPRTSQCRSTSAAVSTSWRSVLSDTSASAVTRCPAGSVSTIASSAGSPVSSATSSDHSAPLRSVQCVRGPA